MTGVIIRQVRYDAVVAQALVSEALAELARRYGGEGDATPVDPAQFTPPQGAFLVAYLDDRPVGCVGWRSHGDDGTNEQCQRSRRYRSNSYKACRSCRSRTSALR